MTAGRQMRQMTGGWEAGGSWGGGYEADERRLGKWCCWLGSSWSMNERRVWQADGGWEAEEADDRWLRGGWQLGKQMCGGLILRGVGWDVA